jgi:spore coat protein SA
LLRSAFRPLLSRLRPGDVVWFINWWEMADPIQDRIRQSGAKFVYHIHNSHQDFALKGGFQRLRPDAIIFISDAMRQEVATAIPSIIPVYTIHNGCEASRFWPAETPPANEIPVVLFVGRLVPYKGVHVLLEAIRILNERKVPVVCRIVGSAHAQARDRKPTAYVTSLQRDAPPNVTFAGFRAATEIAEEFRASDILCCPSTFAEPFGLVNIEAMGCGLPVVGSRIGGIPEIASEGGILLFETGDAADCANKLQQLLLNKDLRLSLREQGLASFNRRFTADAAVAAYVRVAASLTPKPHVLTGS